MNIAGLIFHLASVNTESTRRISVVDFDLFTSPDNFRLLNITHYLLPAFPFYWHHSTVEAPRSGPGPSLLCSITSTDYHRILHEQHARPQHKLGFCGGLIYTHDTMGKLTDVTAQATNTPNQHLSSLPGHQTLQSLRGMGKENLGKSRSPHFMTPTYSSSKQNSAANTHSKGPTSTAEPARPIKIDGMMKSAAKRVGFRLAGDGTPRSRKEGLAKQTKAISFPDKVSQAIQSDLVV